MNVHNNPHARAQEDTHYVNLALEHYKASFSRSHAAKHFVETHLGISVATAQALGFGFGDRTLSHKLAPLESNEGDSVRGALQRIGFLKSNGREKFRGALTLPVMENGVLCNVFGFWFGRNLKPTRKISDAMRDSNGILYNVDAIKGAHTAYLCMTPFDVITLNSLGRYPAVAPLNTSYFTEANTACLLKYGIRKIIVCIPNSESGRRFFRAVDTAVSSIGLSCDVIKTHDVIPLYRANATLHYFMGSDALINQLEVIAS